MNSGRTRIALDAPALLLAATALGWCAAPAFAFEGGGTITLMTGQAKFARLAPDATFATVSFQVDDASQIAVKISVLLDGVSTAIIGPAGEVLNEQTIGNYGGEYCVFEGASDSGGYLLSVVDEPGFHHLYKFPSLGAGSYSVDVEAASPPTEDRAVLIELVMDSPVAASLFATESVVSEGSVVVLSAAVFEATTPVLSATINVWLKPPTGDAVEISLVDNGLEADYTTGDGLYGGAFLVEEVGEYTAVAEITGLTSTGTPFARQATTTIKVVPAHADFAGSFADEGIDTNGNGLFERLGINAPVTIATPGAYVLMIVLKTPTGTEFSAYGRMTLAEGSQVATAYVAAQRLVAIGEDGPYVYSSAELLLIGADGAEPGARLHGGTQATPEYRLS